MTQEFVTLPREVVEQALDALEHAEKDSADFQRVNIDQIFDAATALRAALEQPQNHVPDAGNMVPAGWKLVPVEPTREMIDQMRLGWSDISTAHILDRWKRTVDAAPQPPTVKESLTVEQPQSDQLAMTPIAQRKLDPLLTDGYTISGYSVYHEQKHQHGFVTGAGLVGWWKPEGVEHPQPLGEQEPVPEHKLKDVRCECCGYMTHHREHMGCIRAAQPKREPLTDNQIDKIAESMPGGLEGFLKGWGWRQFARAVLENDHNIK